MTHGGKKKGSKHDWRKISCSPCLLNIITTKIINDHSKRRTCCIVLVSSSPGGMGVSSQQRQLLLKFEWSLEMPFRGPWKMQQFLLCFVKDCSIFIYDKHVHKILWRHPRRGELPLFQTKFKILMNFQCLLSFKFVRPSERFGIM